jgi:adenosylcobinamide-GDP ribazoletransferase
VNGEKTLTIKDRFLSALGFITVLPTVMNYTYSPAGMTPYFPVVGLIVGGLLACFDSAVRIFWNPDVAALFDVIFLIVITGAFHLDGLADTADGFFSHRSRERMLEIMKDSRIGAMGVVALFCGLSAKWAGIGSLPGSGLDRALILLLVPAYARSSLLFGIRFLPYGRAEGTGKGHFDKTLSFRDFAWMAFPVALSCGLGFKGIVLNLAFILMVVALVGYYRKKMGCITGDMLGAMVEVGESVLFLALVMG